MLCAHNKITSPGPLPTVWTGAMRRFLRWASPSSGRRGPQRRGRALEDPAPAQVHRLLEERREREGLREGAQSPPEAPQSVRELMDRVAALERERSPSESILAVKRRAGEWACNLTGVLGVGKKRGASGVPRRA